MVGKGVLAGKQIGGRGFSRESKCWVPLVLTIFAALMNPFFFFNTTLIINIYHSIINITDSFCLVQGIFQPSIPLTHTDAKHNYVSIIQINHIFHQCYLTKQDKCPPRKTTQSVTKKVESRKSRKEKKNLLSAYLWFINRKCPKVIPK